MFLPINIATKLLIINLTPHRLHYNPIYFVNFFRMHLMVNAAVKNKSALAKKKTYEILMHTLRCVISALHRINFMIYPIEFVIDWVRISGESF